MLYPVAVTVTELHLVFNKKDLFSEEPRSAVKLFYALSFYNLKNIWRRA